MAWPPKKTGDQIGASSIMKPAYPGGERTVEPGLGGRGERAHAVQSALGVRQRSPGCQPRGESRAQHDTQVPKSGDVAKIEAFEQGLADGAPEEMLETPDAPQPSRADRRAEAKAQKAAEKRERAQQKKNEREQLAKRQKQATKKQAAPSHQRSGILGEPKAE